MRRTRTYRKRAAYVKPLRDAVAGWRGGVEALVQVHDSLGDTPWLLGGGHATSCYAPSRLCAEIVVVVGQHVELPNVIEVGESFPITLRVVTCADFEEIYRRASDHVLKGSQFRVPCKEDLITLLDSGNPKDWGDLGTLRSLC